MHSSGKRTRRGNAKHVLDPDGNKSVSKFLMVTALAAVGLNTSFAEMKKSGAAPMVHGFLISALVVLVALAVEYFMGILPF